MDRHNAESIAYLSTFPPRECGIATFTKDLVEAIQRKYNPALKAKVLAINNDITDMYSYEKQVLHILRQEILKTTLLWRANSTKEKTSNSSTFSTNSGFLAATMEIISSHFSRLSKSRWSLPSIRYFQTPIRLFCAWCALFFNTPRPLSL